MVREFLEKVAGLRTEAGLSDPGQVNYELIFGVLAIAICSVVFISLWTWAANSERYQKYRIRMPVRDPLEKAGKFKEVSRAVVFDITLYCVYLVLAYDWLIQDGSVGLLTMFGQVLAILLIYDFGFYWVHRLFHHPFLMRRVHGVHHKVRFPKAIDDFYLHPIDSLWVTTLFFSSIAIVGPAQHDQLPRHSVCIRVHQQLSAQRAELATSIVHAYELSGAKARSSSWQKTSLPISVRFFRFGT